MRKKLPLLLIIILLLVSVPVLPSAAADEESKAVKDALTLTGAKAFSREGLIAQLESMGHSHSEAEKAADAAGADWNEMALRQASAFLSYLPLSGQELAGRLTGAGFTAEEADYAVENCGADWKENALKHAEWALYAVTQTLGAPDQSELDEISNPYRVSDEMTEYLTKNIEKIFPIQSLNNTFSSIVTPVYPDLGPRTAVQMRTREGQQTIRLYANPDLFHEYTYTDRINSGNLRNFMLSMDVTINDVYPSDQGGCFIGYTNESITAVKNSNSTLVAALWTTAGTSAGLRSSASPA